MSGVFDLLQGENYLALCYPVSKWRSIKTMQLQISQSAFMALLPLELENRNLGVFFAALLLHYIDLTLYVCVCVRVNFFNFFCLLIMILQKHVFSLF